MQRMRSGDRSKAGRAAWLLRRLASGRSAKWTLIALLSMGLLRVASPLHAQGRTVVTTTLIVQVAEAGSLEQQNDNVVVKLRLTPGVAVTLWSDKACTTPADESDIITASGTYTVPRNQIKRVQKAEGEDEGSICLHSSDGLLRGSLPFLRRVLPPGTMTGPAKSTPLSTWSGHISIPVASRVASAKTPTNVSTPNELRVIASLW
jgi:hypothetical protein